MDHRRGCCWLTFPEVTQVVSQIGRPDDGTRHDGLLQHGILCGSEAQGGVAACVFHENKEELISAMDTES